MKLIPLKLSVTTCYLMKTADKFLLVDTGYEEDWELFQKRLKKIHVGLSQIGYLLLTHHHDDHCGLLHHILQENSAIHVVMSDLCNELIKKGENDLTHGGGLLNKRVAFLIRHKQAYVSLMLHKKVDKSKDLKFQPYDSRKNDILFKGEPSLRDIGIPIEGKILKTPGHTVDSISVLFPDGDCLVGDAAAHMLPFAGTHYCVIFICNMDTYYNSWEKLIKAGAKQIFPAHGGPFPVEKLVKNMRKNKSGNLVQY
ncbi:MAG TPA: MBL fold metallo-hydrolase [Ruminococcaceae bacterium]|nr:MBL fold metallo-hydrolase [Oscillospiraceae bacterium]HCM24366.1 MBL fold metallo-hydrolase [Oscillospiraceae bacterium]